MRISTNPVALVAPNWPRETWWVTAVAGVPARRPAFLEDKAILEATEAMARRLVKADADVA